MNRMDVFEAVEDDLVLREMLGFEQHKKPLMADDPGRDWLQEAYEEALDMSVYLKAEILRRAGNRDHAIAMTTFAGRRRLRWPSFWVTHGITWAVIGVTWGVMLWLS